MPAFVVTVRTPLGDKHIAVKSSRIQTPEDAEAHVAKLQAKQPPRGKQPYAPAGEVVGVRPAEAKDMAKRPPQMIPM